MNDNVDLVVGQVWENVTTLDRLKLRSIECECYLVFECLPSRMLSNRCCYSEDSWRALVEQGHYRLLPNADPHVSDVSAANKG